VSAAERIVHTLNARRVREDEYRARCPVHQGNSASSLSIKNAGGRALVHCFAGCELRDILSAIGMKSSAELFDSVRTKPDPLVDSKARAIRGLEAWAQRYLLTVCKFLRDIDAAVALGSSILTEFEDGRLKRSPDLEETCWTMMGTAYKFRSYYEHHFSILNSKDLQAKLDLWREVAK
jgi:hypothetical protein